jgi:hypothetical protein
MEIDNLTEGADIVRFIKAQRIKWLGHIQRKNLHILERQILRKIFVPVNIDNV